MKQKSLEERILSAVEEEYNDDAHEGCDRNIECEVTSETLKEKVKELLESERKALLKSIGEEVEKRCMDAIHRSNVKTFNPDYGDGVALGKREAYTETLMILKSKE